MPITVEWADAELRTMIWTFSGKWNWTEYEQARARSRELTAGAKHGFYSIADFSHGHLMPNNALSRFQSSAEYSAFELIMSVIVTQSIMVESLVGVVRRVYPKIGRKLRIVRTVEEAYIEIKKKKIADGVLQE